MKSNPITKLATSVALLSTLVATYMALSFVLASPAYALTTDDPEFCEKLESEGGLVPVAGLNGACQKKSDGTEDQECISPLLAPYVNPGDKPICEEEKPEAGECKDTSSPVATPTSPEAGAGCVDIPDLDDLTQSSLIDESGCLNISNQVGLKYWKHGGKTPVVSQAALSPSMTTSTTSNTDNNATNLGYNPLLGFTPHPDDPSGGQPETEFPFEPCPQQGGPIKVASSSACAAADKEIELDFTDEPIVVEGQKPQPEPSQPAPDSKQDQPSPQPAPDPKPAPEDKGGANTDGETTSPAKKPDSPHEPKENDSPDSTSKPKGGGGDSGSDKRVDLCGPKGEGAKEGQNHYAKDPGGNPLIWPKKLDSGDRVLSAAAAMAAVLEQVGKNKPLLRLVVDNNKPPVAPSAIVSALPALAIAGLVIGPNPFLLKEPAVFGGPLTYKEKAEKEAEKYLEYLKGHWNVEIYKRGIEENNKKIAELEKLLEQTYDDATRKQLQDKIDELKLLVQALEQLLNEVTSNKPGSPGAVIPDQKFPTIQGSSEGDGGTKDGSGKDGAGKGAKKGQGEKKQGSGGEKSDVVKVVQITQWLKDKFDVLTRQLVPLQVKKEELLDILERLDRSTIRLVLHIKQTTDQLKAIDRLESQGILIDPAVLKSLLEELQRSKSQKDGHYLEVEETLDALQKQIDRIVDEIAMNLKFTVQYSEASYKNITGEDIEAAKKAAPKLPDLERMTELWGKVASGTATAAEKAEYQKLIQQQEQYNQYKQEYFHNHHPPEKYSSLHRLRFIYADIQQEITDLKNELATEDDPDEQNELKDQIKKLLIGAKLYEDAIESKQKEIEEQAQLQKDKLKNKYKKGKKKKDEEED